LHDLDVVFVGGATAPGYRLLGNPRYPNAEADFARTFDLLEKLSCDVFLGAHGSYFDLESKRQRLSGKGPNPFVDSSALRRYAAVTREDHARQLDRERAARPN
jgi:metallo-beta-lactamase class B